MTAWLTEWLTPNESHSHRIARVLVRKKTKYQNALIADLSSYGRCLILDGEIQSAQRDEFIYHEALVHPALILQAKPEKVLILGGGEGATTREILKHKGVKSITMVDIDGEVVKFCKKYLSSWHQNSFSSRKLKVVIKDAVRFINETDEKFDVIMSDLPTPMKAGTRYPFYRAQFLRSLMKRLNPNGVFVMQAGSGHVMQLGFHRAVYAALKKIYKVVRPYYVYVPSFNTPWAFIVGSNSKDSSLLTMPKVKARLKKNVKGVLRFYDEVSHMGLFHLSKDIRTVLDLKK